MVVVFTAALGRIASSHSIRSSTMLSDHQRCYQIINDAIRSSRLRLSAVQSPHSSSSAAGTYTTDCIFSLTEMRANEPPHSILLKVLFLVVQRGGVAPEGKPSGKVQRTSTIRSYSHHARTSEVGLIARPTSERTSHSRNYSDAGGPVAVNLEPYLGWGCEIFFFFLFNHTYSHLA